MSEPWRGFLVSFAGPGGRKAASRADLPTLRGALAARQPTHRRPTPSSCPLVLLTRPFWPLAGSSPQRYLPIQMGSPRFALLLLLLRPKAGTPLSLKNTLQERQVRGLLSSVPERARILEIDAIDGHRNLYYLPAGCSITQWLDEAPTATQEFKTNQTAKTKELDVCTVLPRAPDRPPRLPKDEFDVAFGVRCLQRALARGGSRAAKRLVDEVLASCAPHTGKFCFIEGTEMEATLAELCVEIKILRSVRVELSPRPPRHGRDLLDSVALPVPHRSTEPGRSRHR